MTDRKPIYFKCIRSTRPDMFSQGVGYEVAHYDSDGAPVVATNHSYRGGPLAQATLPFAGVEFEPIYWEDQP